MWNTARAVDFHLPEYFIYTIDVVNSKYEKNFALKDDLRLGLTSIGQGSNTDYFIWYINFQEWNDYGWEEKNDVIQKIQERTKKDPGKNKKDCDVY